MKGETGTKSSKRLPPRSLCCAADMQKEFGRKSQTIPTAPWEHEQEGTRVEGTFWQKQGAQ